jgi:hypothetical protein
MKIKNPFYKFSCKVCKDKYQTYSIIKCMRHLKKEHNRTLTKRDIRFVIKHHIVTQILNKILLFPIAFIVVLLMLALCPFHWLYEFLDNL